MASPKKSKKKTSPRASQMRWLLREMIRIDELKPKPPKGKRGAKKRSLNTRRPLRVM